MTEIITAEQYDEKYGDMMLNGLSSSSTYIPLKTNKRYGLNIAIRPYVVRQSAGVMFFGGKLRVGFTIDDNGEFEKAKIVDLHYEDRVTRLADFCKGFSWLKGDDRRFSTIVGLAVAAGPYDQEVLDKIIDDGLALDLINKLEATYSKYNDGQTFNSKRKAAAALADAWLIQGGEHIQPLPVATKMPEEVLGKTSKLLNQATDKYGENVVSFKEKVAELKAKYDAE